jgi:hypothetical protein
MLQVPTESDGWQYNLEHIFGFATQGNGGCSLVVHQGDVMVIKRWRLGRGLASASSQCWSSIFDHCSRSGQMELYYDANDPLLPDICPFEYRGQMIFSCSLHFKFSQWWEGCTCSPVQTYLKLVSTMADDGATFCIVIHLE